MPESWRASASRPSGPTDRIALIENSLRCLTYGWLTLVPVAGAFFVIPAVRMFQRVDRERAEWNPAAHLWLRGLVLTCLGFWASLLWWGVLVCWLGSSAQSDQSDGAVFTLLLYLVLFGSAPTLLGLGFAAARWPSRFGVFVYRRHVILLWLMGVAYLVLLQVVCLNEMENGGTPFGPRISPELTTYGLVAVWLTWVLGGFVGLVRRSANKFWWLVWLTGSTMLTLRLAGGFSTDSSFRDVAPYVMLSVSVGCGVSAIAAICFRQRWLALGCFMMALWFHWLGGR